MKYAIGQKVFDKRVKQNFLIVDAGIVDETVVYTLQGLGSEFEQTEEFLASAKRGKLKQATDLKNYPLKSLKSLKINRAELEKSYIRPLFNSLGTKTGYEILPTPEELLEMERVRSAPTKPSKPKPEVTYYTVATAPRELINAAMHKVHKL